MIIFGLNTNFAKISLLNRVDNKKVAQSQAKNSILLECEFKIENAKKQKKN